MTKYLKLYNTDTERTSFESSANYEEPYTSRIKNTTNIFYNKSDRQGGQILPYDAEIEYIKSTGTQRIFFNNYIVNPNTEYYLTLKFDNKASNWSSANKGVYGGVITGGDTDCCFSVNFGGSTNQTTTLFWWTNKTYQSGASVKSKDYGSTIISNKNTIHYTNGNINYGGTNFAVTTKTTTNGQGFTLFGTGSTTPFSAYNMYVYNFKLIENSITIHDYIPVRIGQTGYLYDKVSGELFGNAGTDNFILGADI